MKKLISILVLVIMIMGVCSITFATTSSKLADEIYAIGKNYGMTEANRVRIERYLKENPVSDEVADKVLAKIKEGAAIFDSAKAGKYSSLTSSQKNQIISIANETASLLGLTLKFKSHDIEIYKNGKLIEVARYDGSKLIYTGNNVNSILVVSSVVVIALVAGFAFRKKFANA